MQVDNTGVSAVILTYNTPLDLLKKCLEAIYTYNDIHNNLEIIIVDNNSDNQLEINNFVTQNFGTIKIINSKQNGGYGFGNNLGIKAAKYETVILINPDAEIIHPIFKWGMESFNNDASLKLLGLQQVNQYNQPTHSFLIRKHTVLNFLINFVLLKINKFSPKYAVISGACFFLRKSSFMEVGAYDEQIFLYGEERYLHEHILLKYPDATIKIDNTKHYKHPITDRKFSMRIVELGVKSYFYLQEKLGKSRSQTFKEMVAYYRFQVFFYKLKGKQSAVNENKEIIKLLHQKFEA